jgi:hypothetical protein
MSRRRPGLARTPYTLGAFFDFDYLVCHESVGLPVNGLRRFLAGSFAQAEDLTLLLVVPVPDRFPAHSVIGNRASGIPNSRKLLLSAFRARRPDVERPRHYGLAHLVGSRGAILERYESGLEDGSVDQCQVDVGQASEDRLSTRAAEDLREHG